MLEIFTQPEVFAQNKSSEIFLFAQLGGKSTPPKHNQKVLLPQNTYRRGFKYSVPLIEVGYGEV